MILGESARGPRRNVLSRNDRFSAVLVVVMVATAMALGVALRGRALLQTYPYADREAGIEVRYPTGWLLDTSGNYVMRVWDPAARPFKTEFTIRVVPVSGQTSVRNVLDSLSLQRSSELPAYRVLSVEEERNITRMTFAYVETDPSPFVQRLSVVVRGMDVVVLDGDRAIIVTFVTNAERLEAERPAFERFFASLTY